jgi:hypothetical protein
MLCLSDVLNQVTRYGIACEDGTGRDGMEWNGMEWNGIGTLFH